MFEFISANPTLSLGIVSPIFLVVGYFYRARNENKKNKKLALYSLLEIWHRLSSYYISDVDTLYEKIMHTLMREYPEIKISNQDLELAKAQFTPLIIQSIRDISSFDLSDYQKKYQDVISLISSDDPIFAYKISSASSIDKIADILSNYMDSSFENITDSEENKLFSLVLKGTMTKYVETDSIQELESNIKTLAMKISFGTYFKSVITIYQRKKRINNTLNVKIKEVILNVLIPAFDQATNMLNNKIIIRGSSI